MVIDIQRIFDALHRVLKEDLKEELLAVIDECEQCRETKGELFHRFEEWIVFRIWKDQNLSELQKLLGRRNTKQLLIELGVKLQERVLSSDELRKLLEKSLGLPDFCIKGREFYLEKSRDFLKSKPSQVVSEIRQVCERMLREILLVALNTRFSELIIDSVKKNEKIRIPHGWEPKNQINRHFMIEKLNDDSSGDLGFLFYILAEASRRIEENWKNHEFGLLSLPLLTQKEEDTLHRLAKTLASYVHFKPSKEETRDAKLFEVLNDFKILVKNLDSRRVIPKAAIFLEHHKGLFGSFYRGIAENGAIIKIKSDDEIPLLKRILFWEISNPVHRVEGWTQPNW